MKVSVRVRGEWFAVPCSNGKQTIEWLGTEAVSKYMKLSKMDSSNVKDHNVAVIRRTQGGAILDPSDTISTVLDDNDFLTIVLESDILAPESEHDPPHILYVPERLHGKHKVAEEFLALDGNSLSTDELLHLGYGDYKIRLTTEAENEVIKSRKIVDEIVEQNKVVYGITTGFGKFAKVSINKENLKDLQKNLIRSHAAGIGQPLSPENTRMLLALRINVLAKGYSGISLKTLKSLIEAFNADCLPWVPEKGTVGASGDLAPLSHLALGMMGEGKMWCPNSGWGDAKYVLESNNLKPIELQTKEGLALINGTQLITSLGAAAVERAGSVARQADVVAALTLDVLKGSSRAFDAQVHKIRPHKGQIMVAGRLRSLLHSEFYKSEIAESHRFCNRVQDAYTLRCCPQVHGISHETIDFVKGIITTEMNSATDNPLIMSQTNETISAGNFHGEYPAKALDYLAIAVHELANMSERRIERLVNPALSELPAFLVKDGGLNSGFMIGHCAAASLVSENKVLCHPASIDSLSTSAGTEDHVSMGGFSARKALSVVDNVEHVIAIELLAACQAIEFLRPLKTTAPLEAVYKLVRTVAKPWDKDRYMAPDIEAVTKLIKQEKVWETVKGYIESYNSQKIVETHPFSPTAMANCPPSKKRRTTSRNNNNNK